MLKIMQCVTNVFNIVGISAKRRNTRTISPITVLKITSIIIFLQLSFSSSINLIQIVEAALPVSEITRSDSEGQDVSEGASFSIQPGDNARRVTFEFRGFDDNDQVLELQCSWDGVNYAQSNCSIVSAQSQATFTGPDGVSRLYYLKTGTATRELVPGTYTFGVRMLNSNMQLSDPPVTRTFNIVQLEAIKTATVNFESIKVNNDHDGFGLRPLTCCSGDWELFAFVQGHVLKLKEGSVDGGHSYTLNKEISATINPNLPLSVATIGKDTDNFLGMCKINYLRAEADITEMLTLPPTQWERKLLEYQAGYGDGGCGQTDEKLGLVNEIYPWPSLGAGPHTIISSNKDFELTYTISVENTGTTAQPLSGSIGGTDTDKDGKPDNIDNCRTIANPDQKDTDRDKKGDKCDSDIDNDGVANLKDNCRFLSNANQNDLDEDGKGDRCDTDADGDGKLDRLQNREPLVPREPAQ